MGDGLVCIVIVNSKQMLQTKSCFSEYRTIMFLAKKKLRKKEKCNFLSSKCFDDPVLLKIAYIPLKTFIKPKIIR